ncbi:phosphatidylinositol N-acetylglucosaminyltransferase subunit Q isoform X2 [Leguminivora glycinivorella]|uniref:phosphatidylinositol N-acetylglucosaminyltransferase subunit Q isoform X2 n=1 Tax=Leguminivora glycinivorella TaxID=1035111 RepID=UPI00200C0930|nr:phosphatidylinositol N-acetylglucosaminyltransferase subunit Q isoform X2 [Leguminivora glycinivorella]
MDRLTGYYRFSGNTVLVYFVEHSYIEWKDSRNQENIIYGFWNITKKDKNVDGFKNMIVFNCTSHTPIRNITIHGRPMDVTNNCILLFYEYDKIKHTEIKFHSNEELMHLQCLIQKDRNQMEMYEESYKPFFVPPSWLSYSMVGQHVSHYLNLAHWFLTSVWRNKKISIKQGNLILAVFVDILLGYIALQFVMINEKELSDMLMNMLETIVNSLYTLLKWLMGVPAGLKLNNAFNKMLGKYFSYHIQLWWLFLEVTGEKLEVILQLFHYIGYAGITFQAAIISDMLCIATFHSYCIYVYAARLFNIQISGLIALLRLFVGRKYNPLRGGIDSCEYTNQELFVGTVAFTILLLLLPTTTMYYAVFTLFRLLSLVLQHALAKLIYLIHTLSIYVVALWLTNSSKVAGNILLEVISNEDSAPMILKLKLFKKSIHDLVNSFTPPVEVPKQIEWTNLFSNLLTGKQII